MANKNIEVIKQSGHQTCQWEVRLLSLFGPVMLVNCLSVKIEFHIIVETHGNSFLICIWKYLCVGFFSVGKNTEIFK